MNIRLFDEEGICIRLLKEIKIIGKHIEIQHEDGEKENIGVLSDEDPNDIGWMIDGSFYSYFTVVGTEDDLED